MEFPKKLQQKLDERQAENLLRQLFPSNRCIDFSSNDYLGFSSNQRIYENAQQLLKRMNLVGNGATGSRLLSGNHSVYDKAETNIATFHKAETALIFNSGYNANIGFFSSVPQRGDFIFYDELIHASIRDGIQMSLAKSYKFAHHNLEDLKRRLRQAQTGLARHDHEVYIVTESVFSMDGDTADLVAFAKFCKQNNCHLIIDEAHAIGVFGEKGCGRVQELGLEHEIFARIMMYGKALGCHGAAILGSTSLQRYLVNFTRSFIYTTALPPHAIATIEEAYNELKISKELQKLRENINYFTLKIEENRLQGLFIHSHSAIQCCIIPGNKEVKAIAHKLNQKGFDVKAILSPTVAKGKERLRFCLHSYNSKEEISEVLSLFTTFVTH